MVPTSCPPYTLYPVIVYHWFRDAAFPARYYMLAKTMNALAEEYMLISMTDVLAITENGW